MSVVQNPLDFPGNPIKFEATHVVPSAGHNKEGVPYYKITMLLKQKEDWLIFQEAALKGASFAVGVNKVESGLTAEAEGRIAERGEKTEPTGQHCREAIGLCKDGDFMAFVHHKEPQGWVIGIYTRHFAATEADAKEFILTWCGVDSRKALDGGEPAGRFSAMKAEYKHWLAMERGSAPF